MFVVQNVATRVGGQAESEATFGSIRRRAENAQVVLHETASVLVGHNKKLLVVVEVERLYQISSRKP